MFKEKIIEALHNAELTGFTIPLQGELKRFVVANTHNIPRENEGISYTLLNNQANTLSLAYTNINVGWWLDDETKLLYIDISTSFDNIKDAIEFAKETKQIAIWDNLELKEIRVEY